METHPTVHDPIAGTGEHRSVSSFSRPTVTRDRYRPGMATPEPDAYCLRVSLLTVEPEIWRRMLVPSAMTLGQLHRTIQVAMGWGNQHLHEFEIGGACYGPMDEDADDDLIDDATVTLAEVVTAGDRFEYLYDFGDAWVHQVTVESTTSNRPALKLAVCVAGERSGRPRIAEGPEAMGRCSRCWRIPPTRSTSKRASGWAPSAIPTGVAVGRCRL